MKVVDVHGWHLPRVVGEAADLPPQRRPRNDYHSPRLVVFGSLVELTQSGKNDFPFDPIPVGSTQTA
jgi:hypothetical protein